MREEAALGRTLSTVDLWTGEGTGAFNSWNDTLELGRRKDGSFSLRLRRRGIEEPYVCTLYRSRPRTPQRLLDELQRGVADGAGEQLYRDFTSGDLLNMLAALIDFDPTLARDTLRILAGQVSEGHVGDSHRDATHDWSVEVRDECSTPMKTLLLHPLWNHLCCGDRYWDVLERCDRCGSPGKQSWFRVSFEEAMVLRHAGETGWTGPLTRPWKARPGTPPKNEDRSMTHFATTNPRPVRITSESVWEGHPDKVCDYIADSILDAYLAEDPHSRVACEVLCKCNLVVVAGEVSSLARIDYERVVREAIGQIGYTNPAESFSAESVQILLAMTRQSAEIGRAVDGADAGSPGNQGAGDQGIMFGYATDETPELMPLPIVLAHALTKGLAEDRRARVVDWLRPDAKAQVSVVYDNGRPSRVSHVLVSTQHTQHSSEADVRAYVCETLASRALGRWFDSRITFIVNPSGSFTEGGPSADCGVTGRKIIVDSYGGVGRHGGGAFSGKDPSKVDRSGAYFCRSVARALVTSGIAQRAELQVSYAIGQAAPLSLKVGTFGTGDEEAVTRFVEQFDFRPGEIIRQLDLLRPIYRSTTNYGHFGRPGLPWESAKAPEGAARQDV